jgi:hypothetical protein
MRRTPDAIAPGPHFRTRARRLCGEAARTFFLARVDGADHTFSRSSSRAVLEKILSDELFAPQG